MNDKADQPPAEGPDDIPPPTPGSPGEHSPDKSEQEEADSQPPISDEPPLPDAEDLPGTPRPDKRHERPSSSGPAFGIDA